MRFSRLSMWRQGVELPHRYYRSTVVHTPVLDGPSDGNFEVVVGDGEPIRADENGNFLIDPDRNPVVFDAVHTFAVARLVRDMYHRALRRAHWPDGVSWQWGARPLKLLPRAGEDRGANYSREDGCIRFFSSTWQKGQCVLHTCQSFDIVAHEVGHAVLDGLKPNLHRSVSGSSETVALHESFADLAAIFALLCEAAECRRLLTKSAMRLRDANSCAAVAERYGLVVYGRQTGLRTAFNDYRLGQHFETRHQLSQVFTGAVYCSITYLFDELLDLETMDPVETLLRAGKHLLTVLMSGLIAAPDREASFADVAREMVAAEARPEWRSILTQEFERRQIL